MGAKNSNKILIVDDAEGLTQFLQKFLESKNYEVRTANDGENGYATSLEFNPDLIVTDIQMPGISGLDMMRCVRMHKPNVRTIYMSGDLDSYRSRLRAEQRGYHVKLLAKPFTSSEFLKLITNLSDAPPNGVNELTHH
jgi:DNA-binding response OmpR family regulator